MKEPFEMSDFNLGINCGQTYAGTGPVPLSTVREMRPELLDSKEFMRGYNHALKHLKTNDDVDEWRFKQGWYGTDTSTAKKIARKIAKRECAAV